MSSASAHITTADELAGPEASGPSRSWIRRILGQTLIRWGARVGLAWVGLLVLAAVFAPLLASSHPILMKKAGVWSSPMLRHLTPVDVSLLLLAVATIVLLCLRRLALSTRFGLVVWIGAVTAALALWPTVIREWPRWQEELGWRFLVPCVVVPVLIDVVAIVLIPVSLRLSWLGRGIALLCMSLMAVVLISFPVRPPQAVVYSQYREWRAAGQVDFVLHAPIAYSPSDRLRDQPEQRLSQPSPEHWLGTTRNSADLLSNMIYGARIALSIGFISTGIAIVIGIIIGGLMGDFSGIVDLLGMRFVEVFSAIPTFFLLLIFVAVFSPNLYIMMAIIGVTSWVGYALFIRAEFLKLRQQDFVQAARACGLPLRSILFRHMLPNGVAPVLVSASFGVAGAILAEATLSFLGIGLVEEASWGKLLNQALDASGVFTWWIALFPGLAIFLTVFAYNLVGEALRDAIDPHTQRAAQL